MIRVVCAIVVENNRILLCQRNFSQSNARFWEFPGGKMHPGETTFNAIKREISEELSIAIKPVKQWQSFMHNTPENSIELIPMLCFGFKGKIELKEHLRYQFCTVEELGQFELSPADRQLAAYISANHHLTDAITGTS